jgi:hypothetical protein
LHQPTIASTALRSPTSETGTPRMRVAPIPEAFCAAKVTL